MLNKVNKVNKVNKDHEPVSEMPTMSPRPVKFASGLVSSG